MSSFVSSIEVAGEHFQLHHLKAMFHRSSASLIASDIHIGKAAHFRKNGIPIHTFANANNFWNLALLMDVFDVRQFVVVGDIIHSNSNEEWLAFIDFLDQFPHINRILVRGNHDHQSDDFFLASGFAVYQRFALGDLVLRHEPDPGETAYQICGHVHPAVLLRGKAHQNLRVPCFYFGENIAFLPAFGTFTGTSLVHPKKGDTIYAIANDHLVRFAHDMQD